MKFNNLNRIHLSGQQRKGEAYALGLSVIEAWFPIFAAFTATALGGLFAYFYSLLIAVVFMFFWWLFKGKTAEIKNRKAYKNLALTSLYITILFALIFVALQYTTATNVAVVLFLQILFGFLFLARKQGETLTIKQSLAALLMTLGAIVILMPGEFSLNIGDLLVLLAAMVGPIANVYQKKARAEVSSETVLLVRSVIALPFIYVFANVFESPPEFADVLALWHWLFLTGVLVLFISKIMWIEAIYLLPINKVNALLAFSPLMTMIFAYYMLNEVPNTYQLIGIIPVIVGGYWITKK